MKAPRNEREANAALESYSDEAAPRFFDGQPDEFEEFIRQVGVWMGRAFWLGMLAIAVLATLRVLA